MTDKRAVEIAEKMAEAAHAGFQTEEDEHTPAWFAHHDAEIALLPYAEALMGAVEALRLIKAEVIDSGNWEANDFGWKVANDSVHAALESADRLLGESK